MEPRINIITLGTHNLEKSRTFYEQGLGWVVSSASNDNICFLQLNNIVLALYPKQALADDAGLKNEPSAFGGITLAFNTRTREEVDSVFAEAMNAGATMLKKPQDAFWGGYSGYFADPDGYPWEVAWNPFFAMDVNGNLKLP